MTDQSVLGVPQDGEIREKLQRLVLADLHGPLGGDEEEFSGENPIDRYPLGRACAAAHASTTGTGWSRCSWRIVRA